MANQMTSQIATFLVRAPTSLTKYILTENCEGKGLLKARNMLNYMTILCYTFFPFIPSIFPHVSTLFSLLSAYQKKKNHKRQTQHVYNSAHRLQSHLILVSAMKKINYKFPIQINISEEVHLKIEKAIAGIRVSRYSQEASEEQLSKRRQGDIYLNDIYGIIKMISYMYMRQIKMYNEFKNVLLEGGLLASIPLEEGHVVNRIDELRKNIALARNERNIETNEQQKGKVSKETYDRLQQRYGQLNQKYVKAMKELYQLKAKDERSLQKNSGNEGTKRQLVYKDPIQEMYHKMADFQNWSKTTLSNQSSNYGQNADTDEEKRRIQEMDQFKKALQSQKEEYTKLQNKYDQMERRHTEKLQELKHELAKEKQKFNKRELEMKRLSYEQQILQEQNLLLRQSLKLQKQQSELLRRNDRKNRRNYSTISAIQGQIEEKNKELYSLLSKSEQEKYELMESTRKLKCQSQILSERYCSLLSQPGQE